MIQNPTLQAGIALAVLSGLMNGTFTLPMRYLGRWSWENVWALFIFVACVAMPPAIVLLTVIHPLAVLTAAPARAEAAALITGFLWGFGAILFGQAVSAVGISMANTLVLATSAALGSVVPILVLAPQKLMQPQGKAVLLGTFIAMLGMAGCGRSGVLRERSKQRDTPGTRRMVGNARPFWVGLLICVGAGLLSALFNVGYSLSQDIISSAIQLGNSAFAGSNLIWLLALAGGSVANLVFCAYLLWKNQTWAKYHQARAMRLYALAILMGLLWGGSIFAYGAAAPKLGKLGPAIGWPISLVVGLLTANLCGLIAGEWKQAAPAARNWMALGVAILLGAIGILGWSSTLA